ncbi:hypothetical protein ACFQ7F_14075 [Streptomyces sp. NPDC056486]|uniref:hypothetical protein n=1 Tax=Streptomyces sp. NPDC056486 TaxID=3345835 RepID=UPI0036860875
MATVELVQERLQSELIGIQSQGAGNSIEILELRVAEIQPSLVVEVDVQVGGDHWRVSLPFSGQEASMVSGDLDDRAVSYLAMLVRTHLFEWWHTKDRERASKHMGRKLN